MLLEILVTRRVSEENASNSSLTRRVTKQGHLLLAALVRDIPECEQRGNYGDQGKKHKRLPDMQPKL